MKADVVSSYIKEAVAVKTKTKQLAEELKEIFDTVKEDEESLGISLPEFKSAVEAAYQYEKQQEKLDKLQQGMNIVDTLGL